MVLFTSDDFDAGGVSSFHLHDAARSPQPSASKNTASIGVSVLMDSPRIEVCRDAADNYGTSAAVAFDLPVLVKVYDGASRRGCRKFFEVQSL